MKSKHKSVLITGSSGLIGAEAVRFFITKGFSVVGIDNDMRRYFFGKEASTHWQTRLLLKEFGNKFEFYDADIRNHKKVEEIFRKHRFDLVIHAAAQPSHDWAVKEPLTDFAVNATATMVLLENYRLHSPEATFIFMSTNKVYGDTPNSLPLRELSTRWELDRRHPFYAKGIDESMSLDHTKHTLFGVSKLSADVMVQEYGRYFGLRTTVFRAGCLTGSGHSGTKLHGFLAYLVKCIATGTPYTIFGYKGKQVRDNIHSSDLVHAFYHVYRKPRIGEVYNIGGSRHSNISLMEAIARIEDLVSKKAKITYSKTNRIGDHIWYISDVSKFRKHYPTWEYQYNMDDILADICRNGHFQHP